MIEVVVIVVSLSSSFIYRFIYADFSVACVSQVVKNVPNCGKV